MLVKMIKTLIRGIAISYIPYHSVYGHGRCEINLD